MSRIGQTPDRDPVRRQRRERGRRRPREGAEGHAHASRCRAASRSRSRAARCASRGPTTTVRTRALHGLARALVANMVKGVVEPFAKELEIQGVGYRADVVRQEAEPAARLLAPDRGAGARRAQGLGRPQRGDPDRGHRPPPGRTVRRRTCASCGRPSPTRARASGTSASTCGARSARRPPARAEARGRDEAQDPRTRSERRWIARKVRTARSDASARRTRALVVFRSARHIYAQLVDRGDGPHARQRLDALGERSRRGRDGQRRGRQARRRGARGAGARRSRSSAWCSTATASSTTAASRRWPKRRGRPDSSSSRARRPAADGAAPNESDPTACRCI